MDIMMPPLREQASPAPWLARRGAGDVPRMVGEILSRKPEATVDEVSEELRRRGAELPGTMVAMWMRRRKAG
jgi:hypothetical protein